MLKSRKWFSVAAIGALLTIAGCSTDNANFTPEPIYNAGSLSATVNGVEHHSSYVKTLLNNGTIDVVGTADNGRVLVLHLTSDAVVGTLTPGGKSNAYASYTYSANAIYITDPAGNSGSITISSRTSKRIAGTFNVQLYALNTTDRLNPTPIVGSFDVVYVN